MEDGSGDSGAVGGVHDTNDGLSPILLAFDDRSTLLRWRDRARRCRRALEVSMLLSLCVVFVWLALFRDLGYNLRILNVGVLVYVVQVIAYAAVVYAWRYYHRFCILVTTVIALSRRVALMDKRAEYNMTLMSTIQKT